MAVAITKSFSVMKPERLKQVRDEVHHYALAVHNLSQTQHSPLIPSPPAAGTPTFSGSSSATTTTASTSTTSASTSNVSPGTNANKQQATQPPPLPKLNCLKEMEDMVRCMDVWNKAQQYGVGINVIDVIESVRKDLESSTQK